MYFAVFAFGAIVGSFLNVVLLRKNTGESIVKDRSRCFSCGKKLNWFELIPIISFFIQRGRCRPPPGGCGSKISWQYPIVEIATGFLAITILTHPPPGGWLGSFSFYFAAFCVLLLVAVYDFKHKIIDRHFLYIFAGFAITEFLFKNLNIEKFKSYGILTLLFSAGIFFFFYFLWKFSGGRWMGRGDADLAFFLALFLGYPLCLFMLLGSFWIGAAVGITLLIAYPKKVTIKSEVPFGPFLALSAFIVWYFSDVLKFIYDLLYF